ncbi:hypothetical protein LAUMK7_01725 [Mycobacterium kansasii]|uniref:Uncharacterized protein n=1 Tax=Mycobacterium kansasii TaxID=1768 RepID=A0A653EZP8_MYCKA|nr:hypothetical protein MKANGN_02590 [Mycobacterium kansasii]VAZ59301.1 hypothetical protein LAUMK22_01097 [Mycobacterium kansasii]VAZ65619.1 hypothetical protein LAUMK40_01746 [Mycobacterium kansasii]VAZ73178.1 hypothetical protein LAUMK7_01725 [Mycobacterium kansasii]VTP02858.1 hypothetical protein BIN_B_03651 [Mycobacterium kansasii]
MNVGVPSNSLNIIANSNIDRVPTQPMNGRAAST